jgi:outer membrane protein assembly factor BamE (lipoprotein component of BamABCDE complex)
MWFLGTMALALLGSASPCLVACSVGDPQVTIGRQFPMERLVAVQKGKTSKRQVEELLGKPYKVDQLETRKERWRYYAREETVQRFAYLIPLKTFVTETEVVITFDGAFVDIIDKHKSQYTE